MAQKLSPTCNLCGVPFQNGDQITVTTQGRFIEGIPREIHPPGNWLSRPSTRHFDHLKPTREMAIAHCYKCTVERIRKEITSQP